MAKKATAVAAVTPLRPKPIKPRKPSSMKPGTGSQRVKTRLIFIYGPPKTRKTGSCSNLPNAKWLISDSNCIPTLDALDRLPPDEDVYEVGSLMETRGYIREMIEAAAAGTLGADFVVFDSITALCDFHQQDLARATNQRFMGDNAKNNGWQQFNAEFGNFLDDLTELSGLVTVVVIAHAREKQDSGKGAFAGLALPPQMAEKAGRLANWLLFKTLRSTMATDDDRNDDQNTLVDTPMGKMKITSTLHTKATGVWMASANARKLEAEESPDLLVLLEKEGLVP